MSTQKNQERYNIILAELQYRLFKKGRRTKESFVKPMSPIVIEGQRDSEAGEVDKEENELHDSTKKEVKKGKEGDK